jgi:hypothetical protein
VPSILLTFSGAIAHARLFAFHLTFIDIDIFFHHNIFRAPHPSPKYIHSALPLRPLQAITAYHIAHRHGDNLDTMGSSTPSSGKVKDSGQTASYFFNLPVELQVWITEYLVSSSDRRNLSLVCKHMQALMMPCIYRHMILHPLQLDEHLRSVFNNKHPGLPYIQTLRIRGNVYGVETPNLMPVMCRLLKSIPRDTLRVFE